MSFRLGGTDGVAVCASTWARVLSDAGWSVVTVAGDGPVDHLIRGLAMDDTDPPHPAHVETAIDDADVVVIENLLSLPLNPGAAAVVARALAGRRCVLHHHDLPWQRDRFGEIADWPPDDPAWRHVAINELSAAQLRQRGIEDVTVIRNAFDTDQPRGERQRARLRLGVDPDERVVVHPVRAIARKDVPAAVALAERLGATYWLVGPPEEDYATTLDEVLARARCRVLRGDHGLSIADAYAAGDVVAFPSTWEGFGNPVIESAIHRRPLAVRRYPVLDEIAGLGFEWFDVDDEAAIERLDAWLDDPDPALLDRNLALASRYFGLDRLARDLAGVLTWDP